MDFRKTLLATTMAAISINVYAADKHTIVAPQCLLDKAGIKTVMASNKQLALTTINDASLQKLVAIKRQASCGGFMDVSHQWKKAGKRENPVTFLQHYTKTPVVSDRGRSYAIKYPEQVKQISQLLVPQRMWEDLTVLTQFRDRYANSNNGVDAAKWLREQVLNIAHTNHRTDVTAYFVKTGDDYIQPSLVVKVGEGTGPGIVIGGHMDTLSSGFENKPGADDDGTGTVTVLEVARTILSSGMHFKKPIYFIWYAAEEMGLVGSQYVVEEFKDKQIPVDAVLQLDMTGYAYQNESTMWLMDDYVSKSLNKFVESLITTYVKQPVKHSRCGYGCSDHASWNNEGFAAAMPFETEMNYDNPDIHTSEDVMSNLSLSHMSDYAKLGAAFVVELAEPVA